MRRADARGIGRLAISGRNSQAADWFWQTALPFWANRGRDPEGGFHDALDDAGRPIQAAHRLRVQARQVYVFARAGSAGWDGPWRDLVEHGLDFLAGSMRRPDGLVWSIWSDGAGQGLALYDQAHALLALAAAASATGRSDVALQAAGLMDRIIEAFGAGNGAFREPDAGAHDLRATPHMHLYEAVLALTEATGEPAWRRQAAEIASFAEQAFLDAEAGRVRPVVGGDTAGLVYEPGLAFEWGALLTAGGRPSLARELIRNALRNGVDHEVNRTFGGVFAGGAPAPSPPRLWGQTERLRALDLLVARGDQDLRPAAEAAEAAVREFLDAAPAGLFRDVSPRMGEFDLGPAKASSLYHLAGALLAPAAAT